MGAAAGRGDGGAPVVVPKSEWNATMAALFGAESGRKKKKPRDASAADAARRMEAAKKAAARDALRRKAERRVYKPANAWMLVKLAAMYGGFVSLVVAQLFFSALAAYVNPNALWLNERQDLAWRVCVCVALLGVPAMALNLCGYLLFPPVWGERFPDRDRALEELGGRLHFRFHHLRRRGDSPGRTKSAVEVCVDVLSRTLPSALWEVEVVTDDTELYVASSHVREFVYKPDTQSALALTRSKTGGGGSRKPTHHGPTRTRVCHLLAHASAQSSAHWGDWIVHMGTDAVLNQRAVDAIVFHCARESRLVALSPGKRPCARRGAQGAAYPGLTRTANDVHHGVGPSVLAWIPAMAEVARAGECHGSIRAAYGFSQRVVCPVPECFVVVPLELERGLGHVPAPPRTEMTSFALRAQARGARFAWLDAGVHVPVRRSLSALFRLRVADSAANFALWRRLAHGNQDDGLRVMSGTGTGTGTGTEHKRGGNEAPGGDLEPAVDFTTRFRFAALCVSSALAKLAPALVVLGAWAKRRPTGGSNDSLYLACALGGVAALVHFQYAVGFYASSSARHLARGAPGHVLYWILFALTLALVPVFSAFEVVATVTGLVWTPAVGGFNPKPHPATKEAKSRESTPGVAGDESSSDGLLGSDGEVRRHAPARKRVPFAWRPRGGDSRVPSGDSRVPSGDLEAPLIGRGGGGSAGGSSSGDGTDSGESDTGRTRVGQDAERQRRVERESERERRRRRTSASTFASSSTARGDKRRWGIGSSRSKASAAPVKSGNHQA